MPRKPFGGKPPPPLAVSDDVEDATDLSKGLATVSVQRQGSFSLSETMTFDSEDIKLRGARGMELSGGDSASSVTLQDLDRLQQLGSGATSRVFLARHRTTGQMLALKELTVMADKDTRHMAVNELRLAHKSSRGDHLIHFVDAFFDEGKIVIAMEFADGGSMDDAIQRGHDGTPGLPEPLVGLMVLQALQGLMYLHREMKQMHRDLKPANVMLTRKGDVKLSDFGISKQLESTDSLAVTQCGTIQYMSPERLMGDEYSFESDVWSVGIIVLEALHGRLPYPNASSFMSQMHQVTKGDAPTPPEGSSEEAHEFVAACLRKNLDGPGARPTVPELFRTQWVRMHAADGSDEQRCARMAAFLDGQLGPEEED